MLGQDMAARRISSTQRQSIWSGLDPDARVVLAELTRLARLTKGSRLKVTHADLCHATHVPLERVADAVVVLAGRGLVEVFDVPDGQADRVIYVLTAPANEEIPA